MLRENGRITLSELYFSVDIETTGPHPGRFSMLSFGAVPFTSERIHQDKTFYTTLEELPGGEWDPMTKAWWQKNPEALASATAYPQPIAASMKRFGLWSREITTTLGYNSAVLAAYPSGFDFTFMYWYMSEFGADSPFGFSSLDMKTLAMGLMASDYKYAAKRNMPKNWFGKFPHTHNALDDALGQAHMGMMMLRELDKRDGIK